MVEGRKGLGRQGEKSPNSKSYVTISEDLSYRAPCRKDPP